MRYDIIAVLSYRFEDDWSLPLHVKKRIKFVSMLYNEHKTQYIAVCGKWSIYYDHRNLRPPHTEADLMKKLFIQQGIPQEKIFKEEMSEDTIGNAYFLKTQIIIPHHFRKVLIVCADYHLLRVRYIFEKVFGLEYELEYNGNKD